MKAFLKIIFLYLPAAFAYYSIITAALILAGIKDDPTAFNPDDYTPVVQSTSQDGTQVSIYELK